MCNWMEKMDSDEYFVNKAMVSLDGLILRVCLFRSKVMINVWTLKSHFPLTSVGTVTWGAYRGRNYYCDGIAIVESTIAIALQ